MTSLPMSLSWHWFTMFMVFWLWFLSSQMLAYPTHCPVEFPFNTVWHCVSQMFSPERVTGSIMRQTSSACFSHANFSLCAHVLQTVSSVHAGKFLQHKRSWALSGHSRTGLRPTICHPLSNTHIDKSSYHTGSFFLSITLYHMNILVAIYINNA